MHLPVRASVSLGLVIFCSALAGCDSAPRRNHFDRDSGVVRPVAMRGDALFFNQAVQAEVSISRGRPLTNLEKDSGDSSGDRREGGRGHGRRRGGMGGGGMDGMSGAGSDEGGRAVERPVGMPPLTLRLKLTNLSAQPQDVLIHDFTSDLGNFAVRPESVVVAPNQSVEVDPMVSQLGAMADELPVTVVLRAGGRTETQVVTVKNIAPAEAAPRE